MKGLSWSVLHLGSLLKKCETAGMRWDSTCSCRWRDNALWLCASLSCHDTLNTISALSSLPKHRGLVWGTPARDQSKKMQIRSRYTSVVWASENKRTAEEGRGINSPSSLHRSPISAAFWLPFCNSFSSLVASWLFFFCPSLWFVPDISYFDYLKIDCFFSHPIHSVGWGDAKHFKLLLASLNGEESVITKVHHKWEYCGDSCPYVCWIRQLLVEPRQDLGTENCCAQYFEALIPTHTLSVSLWH